MCANDNILTSTFFHFYHLKPPLSLGRRIITTSDREPEQVENLKSRFSPKLKKSATCSMRVCRGLQLLQPEYIYMKSRAARLALQVLFLLFRPGAGCLGGFGGLGGRVPSGADT